MEYKITLESEKTLNDEIELVKEKIEIDSTYFKKILELGAKSTIYGYIKYLLDELSKSHKVIPFDIIYTSIMTYHDKEYREIMSDETKVMEIYEKAHKKDEGAC